MLAGDILQQLYNIADTLIVSRAIGRDALAAVGSAYTLMIFLTSILLGLSMGAGALFSICRGRGDESGLRRSIVHAFGLIGVCALILTALAYALLPAILRLLQVPEGVSPLMRTYLAVIFAGIPATFLYNFFRLSPALGRQQHDAARLFPAFRRSATWRSICCSCSFSRGAWRARRGQRSSRSTSPGWGSPFSRCGAAPICCRRGKSCALTRRFCARSSPLSSLTCVQQSVMNFGILMIQGLVNSFGEIVMAAFAAAVKIESFAYMPAQDFGNAFSTFVAQNFGARQTGRIRAGIRRSFALVLGFCAVVSAAVLLFASPLMRLFIPATDTEVIREGVYYLRCVAPFYFGIGFLFLFYALCRAVKKPAMSVVLTVVSLGTRVALAYLTSGTLGVTGIWAAIPIGWVLADITGAVYYFRKRKALLPETGQ